MKASSFSETCRSLFHAVRYRALVGLFYASFWLFNKLCKMTYPLHSRWKSQGLVRLYALWWIRAYLAFVRWTGNFIVEYSGFENFRQIRGEVFVCNHPCLLDAFLLLALAPHFIVVFKATLHKDLVEPATTELSGFISNASGRQTIREAVEHLKAGRNILVFPEGTRTERWPFLPMIKGYALMAWKAQAPVRVVTFSTRSDALSKQALLKGYCELPLRFRLCLSEPITPASTDSADALCDQVEAKLWETLWDDYADEFTFQLNQVHHEVKNEQTIVKAQVRLPESPAFCRGHFPGHPILPAYAILLFCAHATRRLTGAPLVRRRWERVKFTKPLRPGTAIELCITKEANQYSITLSESGTLTLSGLLTDKS